MLNSPLPNALLGPCLAAVPVVKVACRRHVYFCVFEGDWVIEDAIPKLECCRLREFCKDVHLEKKQL
jgi:hypothetical protein